MQVRHLIGIVAVSATLFSGVGVAYATEPTGPDTAACAQATQRVAVAAQKANDAGDDLADAQQNLAAAQSRVQTALDKVVDLRRALVATPAPTGDAKAALESQLTAAVKEGLSALDALVTAAVPSSLTNDATKAKVDLEAAVAARTAACITPAPSNSVAPSSSAAPVPGFVDKDCEDFAPGEAQRTLDADKSDPHQLDADHDGIACEVSEDDSFDQIDNADVPQGGVETGEL